MQSPLTKNELFANLLPNSYEVLAIHAFSLTQVKEILIASINFYSRSELINKLAFLLTPQATSALLNAFIYYLKICKTRISIPDESPFIHNSIFTLDLSNRISAQYCKRLLEQITFSENTINE